MGRRQGPRKGSMQVWPRKRAEKFLPRVNWEPVLKNSAKKPEKANILGFIGYKAGMASAFVKDNTADSMTKSKKIIVPATVIECPSMKILSVRFYKNGKVIKEVLNDNLDKELKRIVRMPKKKINAKELVEKIEKDMAGLGVDEINIVAYSQPKKTGVKKTPDISEIAVSGSNFGEKLNFIKENLGKEISVAEVFQRGLVDTRGITKGKGFQGTIKRFGVHLRQHKSEKGQRRVGSIGAWHPIGVRFRVPMPGQMGLFSRITYNNSIISSKKFSENDAFVKNRVFDNYGQVKNDYLVIAGSVQGPQKRQILITAPLRPTKKQLKKQYELIELR